VKNTPAKCMKNILTKCRKDTTTDCMKTTQTKDPKNLRWLIPVIVIAAAALVAVALSACGQQGKNYRTVEDVAKYPVSIMTGSAYADIAKEEGYLNEDTVIMEYNSELDAVEAVRNGKVGSCIDCYIYAMPFLESDDDLTIFPQTVGAMDYAFGFQKGDPLCDEFNKAMAELKAEGLEEELSDKWLSGDESKWVPMEQDWVGEKGTLRYWVNSSTPPMAYVSEGGQLTGYSVDFVTLVAKRMGYNVEVTECSFGGLIPALQADKCDIAGRSMAVTEERKESIDFSDTFLSAELVLMIRKVDLAPELLAEVEESDTAGTSFLRSLVDSFVATFITEDRWQMFLDGIGVTMIITVLSAIFGTALGLLAYVCFSKKNSVFNSILLCFNRWLSGVPVVVVLMIMYYIILCQTPFSGVTISIITFTILFAIGVFGLICTGVEAVPKGQIESAIDLGFTQNQIFSQIVLPQTIIYIMPLYRSRIIEHLEATAIVGYIAVMDLTKISDMIRSRTFDAFFPLIATAIIYYLLGRLLDVLLRKAEYKIKPGNHRSRLLKEVNQNDQN